MLVTLAVLAGILVLILCGWYHQSETKKPKPADDGYEEIEEPPARETINHALPVPPPPSLSNAPGRLKVLIVKAQGLKASDFMAKSDPYVILRLGRQEKKTSVVKQHLNP